jgi:DNA ligase-1
LLRFAGLVKALRQMVDSEQRIMAIQIHLQGHEPAEAAWTLRLLADPPPPARISPRRLQKAAEEASCLPDWLVKASKELASASETAARILPNCESEDRIVTLQEAMEHWAARVSADDTEPLLQAWMRMNGDERLVFNQLVSSQFRSPVPRAEALEAASRATGVPLEAFEAASLPCITPSAEWWNGVKGQAFRAQGVRAIPISTLYVWDEEEAEPTGWIAGWGHLGRIVLLGWEAAEMTLISQHGENFATHFPDLARAAQDLPEGSLLEGSIVAGDGDEDLSRRLERPHPATSVLKKAPARFAVHDVLAWDGEDLRGLPWNERIQRIAPLSSNVLQMVDYWTIEQPLAVLDMEARCRGHTSFWLRDPDSAEADHFVVHTPPHLIQAVLTTLEGESEAIFAVRHGDQLVPIAKAPLTVELDDIDAVRRYVRANTLESFGPVRVVRPGLVFELEVESFSPSRRRKAKVSAWNAKVLRLREDLKLPETSDVQDIWDAIGLQP